MVYSENQKGYLLYDLTNKIFFVNRDIIFKENVFPFKHQQKATPIFNYAGMNNAVDCLE